MRWRLSDKSVQVLSVMVIVFLVACGTRMALANDNVLNEPMPLDQNITVNDGWHYFEIDGPVGSFNIEGAFLFTSTGDVRLLVTDIICRGDQYRIYDNGVPVGDTSVVPANDENCDNPNNTFEYDVAYDDPGYSHGNFLLHSGSHAITIEITVPYRSGSTAASGGLKVQSVKPIPTLSQWGVIIFLVLLAGSAVWIMRRRRRTA